MNELKDIDKYSKLQKLISIFMRVNQLSWTSDQTRKRYPNPEMMTEDEMDSLTKAYLALGFDLESVYKEWKKIYDEYEK